MLTFGAIYWAFTASKKKHCDFTVCDLTQLVGQEFFGIGDVVFYGVELVWAVLARYGQIRTSQFDYRDMSLATRACLQELGFTVPG